MLNISPKLPPTRDIRTFFSISLEFHTKTRDIEIRISADRSDWTVAPDSRVREKHVHVRSKSFQARPGAIMSVYVCPVIRRMADGRRHAQPVSNMASCVCPGMRRPQGTARSYRFPTILFSFACRGIQDAHADRNNVPVSHTSRHGI